MVRVASGTGKVASPTGDKALDALVLAWAKASRADITGAWKDTEPGPVVKELARLFAEANATAPATVTLGLRSAMVALSAQRATKGGLQTDLPPAHRGFLAAFAQGAGLALHVHAMIPGRGSDAELAAVTALGQAWQLPASASAAHEPATALSRSRLIAFGKDQAATGIERTDLPEVAGARRRAAEVRKPRAKKTN